MKKILWLIYQPYKWLIVVPILGISAMIFSILAVSFAYLVNAKVGAMIGGIGWARLCSFFTPMWVKRSGLENIDRKQSYIVVSNHQSHYDIFVIYGWLWMDVKWVMKKELRKVPFVGWACEKLEFIIIDRSDKQKAIESLNAAKAHLINGTSAMFFPEGTRSKTGAFGPFKKGAFKMAIDLGLPILPISIKGTRKILPSGSFNLKPGRAEMIVHPPISTENYNDNNILELMDKTRQIIEESFH